LSKMLFEYDVGWWTRYSLFPPVAPDLAKPFYHTLHVAQMPALYGMTGSSVFADAAERWNRYDRVANRARAVAAKAPSVIRDSWLTSDRERSRRQDGQDTVDEGSR
jgi:heparosan-N-sulfate-glucuronate 5-epimerase